MHGTLKKILSRAIILGVACSLFLVGGLSAQPREGDITWRPAGTNYVQGPWAVQWQGDIYLGGHAGHFGEPWYRIGDERPWVIRYDSRGVTAQDRVIDLLPNAHEFAFGSMARINGWWLYSAVYTTWDTLGQPDRTHLMLALTQDPIWAPYPYAWWDLPVPAGGVMSALVSVGDRLLLFHGYDIYHVSIHEAGQYKAPAITRIGSLPGFAWSDIALGDDNKLYALVSGDGSCWWFNCTLINEHVSEDGLTWARGQRSWGMATPGGLPRQFVGDACYVRDELGHIKRGALAVVALVTTNPDPASGTWHLRWWADPGFELPVSWGHDPGWTAPRIRRHVTLHTDEK